jgi:phosphoadenosine phosphosulfate reductase
MTAVSPSPVQATTRHAHPSSDFDAKLAQTQALLERAARDYAPVTQASSLGAEDTVITHLIAQRALPITVFVLDTGLLHPQTLALLERTQRATQTPITVYRPFQEAVEQFVAREGANAMYRSIALRKACCSLRKLAPLAQALQGQRAWITGLRHEQSAARADVPTIDTREALTKFNPLSATIAWLDDEPLVAGRVYWALHGHRWVKARITRIIHRLDIHSLQEIDAHALEPNAIGHVELTLQEPLVTLPYTRSRTLGSLVLVDTATHKTAGAVLVRQAPTAFRCEAIPSAYPLPPAHATAKIGLFPPADPQK